MCSVEQSTRKSFAIPEATEPPEPRTKHKHSKALPQCIRAFCRDCDKLTLHLINNVINDTAITCLECPDTYNLLTLVDTLEGFTEPDDHA